MIFRHRPFDAFDGDAFLVSQMIHFVEDLLDEWKEKWLEIKEEYGKTHGGDTGEFPLLLVPVPFYSMCYDNIS